MSEENTNFDQEPEMEEKVGYCQPPTWTRFKPGQTGNPNGRPKGRRNNRSIIREVSERLVLVTEDGHQKKVPVYEALVQSLIAKALKGTTNDQIKVLQLIEKATPEKFGDDDRPNKIIFEFVDTDDNTYSDEEFLNRDEST